MTNQTLEKFNYPAALIAEYDHWVVLLRPAQVTLGSVVIAAKAGVTSVGALSSEAGAEFIRVVADFETTLRALFAAEKFNYLALMMVDPNPHFHALPRYSLPVTFVGRTWDDTAWPKPPNLGDALGISDAQKQDLQQLLKTKWTKQ